MRKIFFLILLFCSLNLISSLEVEILKTSIDNELSFEYSISSSKEVDISYTPYIMCDNLGMPLLELKSISLSANEDFVSSYSINYEQNNIIIQNCSAVIKILTPENINATKEFILPGLKTFDLDLNICKDISCSKKSKVFIAGNDVYLDYSSTVDDLNLIVNLKKPSGSVEEITLPYSFKASEVGSYELSVSAKKKEYKDYSLNLGFAVIEKKPEIKEKDFDNFPVAEPPKEKVNRESGEVKSKSTSFDRSGLLDPNSQTMKFYNRQLRNPLFLLLIFLIIIALILAIVVVIKKLNQKNSSIKPIENL